VIAPKMEHSANLEPAIKTIIRIIKTITNQARVLNKKFLKKGNAKYQIYMIILSLTL